MSKKVFTLIDNDTLPLCLRLIYLGFGPSSESEFLILARLVALCRVSGDKIEAIRDSSSHRH